MQSTAISKEILEVTHSVTARHSREDLVKKKEMYLAKIATLQAGIETIDAHLLKLDGFT